MGGGVRGGGGGVSTHTFTVLLLPEPDGGYIVEVPALPGCVSEGDSLTEALLMAEEAITGYLEVLQEDGDPLPHEEDDIEVRLGERHEALLRRVAVTVPTNGGARDRAKAAIG